MPLNWEFCIAETLKPIIEIDFLSHFDIKIDPRKGRLIFQFLRMNYVCTTTVMAIELINAYFLALGMQMTQCLILKTII